MMIEGRFGAHYDEILIDGKRLDPRPSQKVRNHSPDGFAWGYGGSGPAQLALAILLQAGLSSHLAERLHQRFKAEFVQQFPKDFKIEIDVKTWAEAKGVRMGSDGIS